jgi:hypothetical protein
MMGSESSRQLDMHPMGFTGDEAARCPKPLTLMPCYLSCSSSALRNDHIPVIPCHPL